MRNRMQHEYWNVDADILWQVGTLDMAPLISAIEPLLPEIEASDAGPGG